MVEVHFNKSSAIVFRLTGVAHEVRAEELEAGTEIYFLRAWSLGE